MTGEPIDPGVIELAGRVFELARAGSTAERTTPGSTTAAFFERPEMSGLREGPR